MSRYDDQTLTPEEQTRAREIDTYASVDNLDQEKKKFVRSKKKAINIRLYEEDIVLLKLQAEEIGLPYQTMLSSFLHQLAQKKITLSVK